MGYYTSIATTYSALILSSSLSFICLLTNTHTFSTMILDAVFYFTAYISMMILLAILILRLYTTFALSMYRLSKNQIIAFIILYTLNITLFILVSLENIFVDIVYKGNRNEAALHVSWLFGWLSIFSIFMYFITATYATGLFLKNIMKLAKIGQSTSCRKLNGRQKLLIRKASKYVSLLSLAAGFDSVAAIIWTLVEYLWDAEINHNFDRSNVVLKEVFLLICSICCIVNMICLYLKFSFASKYYNKYCQKWLECGWRKILTLDAMSSIRFQPVDCKMDDDDAKNDETKKRTLSIENK